MTFHLLIESKLPDLLKPVMDIMSMTLLSRVFSVKSQQCHMLSRATVTGFVGTVTGISQLETSFIFRLLPEH